MKTKSKKWWGQYRDACGSLRRHPLSTDKRAAEQMLNELVRRVERVKAGLEDPTDEQRRRPLKVHLAEYKTYLQNKGVTEKQVNECTRQIQKMLTACKWRLIGDVTAASALEFLGGLRREGRSAQTYNHYLKAAKSFTRWMVRERRTLLDPLAHVSKMRSGSCSPELDRRRHCQGAAGGRACRDPRLFP